MSEASKLCRRSPEGRGLFSLEPYYSRSIKVNAVAGNFSGLFYFINDSADIVDQTVKESHESIIHFSVQQIKFVFI